MNYCRLSKSNQGMDYSINVWANCLARCLVMGMGKLVQWLLELCPGAPDAEHSLYPGAPDAEHLLVGPTLLAGSGETVALRFALA